VPYDAKLLVAALDTLLNASSALGHNDAYQYDVVNITRQVLGQLGLPLVNEVESAFTRRDTAALERSERRALRLLSDIDELVGTREEFLLGRWIADAKRWGVNDDERRLYEWNARNLVTLWGSKCTEGENDDLNLYAFKEWQGMFSSYFRPRWEEFFKRLNRSIATNQSFDRARFAADMCEWEKTWSRQTDSFPSRPQGSAINVARRLRREYADLLSQ
jgi:alpha-N-acetylglucosaminidase